MDGPHDWDLLAIVRSCSSTTATTTFSPPPPPPPRQPPPFTCSPTSTLFGFSNPLTTTTSFSTGYQEICSTSTPAFTVSRVVKPLSNTGCNSQSQRTKKRKKLMKVCHVPSEGLSSDKWAWRKYGQKPIKGSPYPRGYYKCSSSKGCLARKQVERNKSDPKMFIITYTSEHNHPFPTHLSTLAGSTRQKPLTPTSTPPASPSAASLSPLTERSETNTDDKQGLSDFMLNNDFSAGFDQIDGVIDDTDCFSEFFSTSSEFPWLANDRTTTTASTVAAAGGVV